MNTKELQKLASQFGSVVILEDGVPSFIILPFNQFKMMIGNDNLNINPNETMNEIAKGEFSDRINDEVVEKLNREIQSLKEEIRMREQEDVDIINEVDIDNNSSELNDH